MAEYDVDLFVIGGGSGGVRAARIAAGYGTKDLAGSTFVATLKFDTTWSALK